MRPQQYIYYMTLMNAKTMLSIATMALFASCSQREPLAPSDVICIDQCGYMPRHPKMAFVQIPAQRFEVIDSRGHSVYRGQVSQPAYWPEAGDTVRTIDFGYVDAVGDYTIIVDDTIASYPVHINHNVYTDVAADALHAFYYNRCSVGISQQFGGKWARPAGHPDTLVMVHASAATRQRPEGTVISSPGGWYDAGDYNKYIVNSGISTYTMLLSSSILEHIQSRLHVAIPESGNSLSDILNETLVNLRWMLTMQDPNDGGVYHKLTTLAFENFAMPADCHNQRYVVAKGTAAALDFAATMAAASRIVRNADNSLSSLADSCRDAALRAYAWAEKNPNTIFRNPEGVVTGEYGDFYLRDEWFWASTEMWLMTDEKKYADNVYRFVVPPTIPSWGNVGALAYYSMATAKRQLGTIDWRKSVTGLADSIAAVEAQSPVALSMTNYDWGSNSTVANHGMLNIIAYKLTDNVKYFDSALNNMHYLLGRNALGRSFVTGHGVNPPMHIHHRISAADGIEDPVPGFLCGGPNLDVLTDCNSNVFRSQYPAKSYADASCSYSTNEIAINWNAPLVFLAWASRIKHFNNSQITSFLC